MTEKEAIFVLHKLKPTIPRADGKSTTHILETTALDLAIKALDQEKKTGRWIPCSEMLPEKNGRYIVTRGLKACGSLWNRVYIVNYSDLMGLCKEKIWWSGNVGKSDFERHDDVLAWMPLPEPYKEES